MTLYPLSPSAAALSNGSRQGRALPEGRAVTTSEARLDLKNQATAISNAIGSLHREHYGRGANRIRTLIHPELVVTTLEDCFTTVERRMIAEGAFSKVRETRTMFQDWMRPHFVDSVEAATGQKVRAFFSSTTSDPEMAVELFLLEPPTAASGTDADGRGPQKQ
jgi:uncharacterized protein YbcI